MSKDDADQWVAISQSGQVESTLKSTRYEQLMERFAIAYEQIQITEYQQNQVRDIEL